MFAPLLIVIIALQGQTSPLTTEEVTLLTLASQLGGSVNGVDLPPPAEPRGGRPLFLSTMPPGRGRRVAAAVAGRDAYFLLINGKVQEVADQYAFYPRRFRQMAGMATGLPLEAAGVSSPFSEAFKDLSVPLLLVSIDRLRKGATQVKKAEILAASAVHAVADKVEAELTLALGRDPLPVERFLVLAGSYGQSLTLKYTGTAPLTRVVLVGRVEIGPDVKEENEVHRMWADQFNRKFGGEEEADDARDYVAACDLYGVMSKAAVQYLPKIAPGDTVEFNLGYMQREGEFDGNTVSLAVYADQGRVSARDIGKYPKLPGPLPSPDSKVSGVRLSAVEPGTGDPFYVGSVWRGTSTTVVPRLDRSLRTITKRWDLIVTERDGERFSGEIASYGADSNVRIEMAGTVRDGKVSFKPREDFLGNLHYSGRMNGDLIKFETTDPLPGNTKRVSLTLTYIPPAGGKKAPSPKPAPKPPTPAPMRTLDKAFGDAPPPAKKPGPHDLP